MSRSKGDVAKDVLKFVWYLEKLTGYSIIQLHTDGGIEFQRAAGSLENDGVRVTFTTPYRTKFNSFAERTHSDVQGLSRTLLTQAKLPLSY